MLSRMTVIHKTKIDFLAIAEYIEIPAGSELLTVHEQDNQLAIWYKCNPTNSLTKHPIHLILTGQPVPVKATRYIGAALFDNQTFVVHVFE